MSQGESEMNFQELGEVLRGEREKKGLTIELVMESTKISRTNLVAIEKGDYATLPHPVYTKGFVKSYARYLGLDADELAMVVDQEYQNEADGPENLMYEVSPATERAFQEKGEFSETKKFSMWPFLLLILLAVVVALFLFIRFEGKKDRPEAVSQDNALPSEQSVPAIAPKPLVVPDVTENAVDHETAPTETEPVAGSAVPSVEGSDEPQGSAVSSATIQSDGDQNETEDFEEPSSPAVGAETDTESRPVAQVEEDTDEQRVAGEPEKQNYDHILLIRATTETGCWVGVWKDNEEKPTREFMLGKGEPLRLMFNSPRRIRIGNVAGVTVTYNGEPYPLTDVKNNTQTLRFGME